MTDREAPDQPAPSSERAAHSAEIAAGQTRLLYDNLPAGLAGTVLIAAIMAAILVGHAPGLDIGIWMAAVIAVSAGRYALLLAYRRRGAAPQNSVWQHRFEIGSFSSGLAWAAASLWLFPADPVRQALMGFILGSMAAGAVSTLGVHLRAYAIYLLPALVPYTAMLIGDGGHKQIGMALVFALGQVVLLVSARRFSDLTIRSLSLKHDNEQLVVALRTALDAANEASKAKSRFLANMSHEIRTPMNGVLGMTEVLQRTPLDDRQVRAVGTIGQSARTLLTIIDDILDLARIEEGKLKPDPHHFALEPCVEDVVALLCDLADKKGLALTLEIDGRVPSIVDGDQGRLRQVLLNLIGNAIKFTESGSIAVRVAPSGDGVDAGMLLFEIRDTGIGMTAETQAQIFQPFVQADTSIRRRFGGSGLGLAISHHLVRMMGGILSVSSSEGVGTTMTITLPMPAVGEARVWTARAGGALAGKRVVLIDPDEVRRAITARYLAEAGAIIDGVPEFGACAHDVVGREARVSPALVVATLATPGDGAEALADRLDTEIGLADTPRLLLAPLGASAVSGRFEQRISLPLRRAELLAKAEEALAGGAHADAHAGPAAEVPPLPRLALDVLVAEDNPVNQLVAEDYLASLGCSVTMAADGAEAAEQARGRRFDVILMDCQMPELDGLAATRRIREQEAAAGTARVAIIAVTANAYADDRRQCLEAGMDDFIAKPFTMEALADVLRRWSGTRDAGSAKAAA